jgi:hypothetical protein
MGPVLSNAGDPFVKKVFDKIVEKDGLLGFIYITHMVVLIAIALAVANLIEK